MSDDEPLKAVALRYDAPAAPKVVAKGEGELARSIVERARAAGVPIEENPALVEALARLKLDETIPEDLYRATAAVIAAVLRAARKG